jgi:hypothetical protein
MFEYIIIFLTIITTFFIIIIEKHISRHRENQTIPQFYEITWV